MKFKRMNKDQVDRLHLQLRRIFKKYATFENKLKVSRVLGRVGRLSYLAGNPLMNLEYFPYGNIVEVNLASDDPRRNVLTIYVREHEYEVRYDNNSFAKFKDARELAVWLEEF